MTIHVLKPPESWIVLKEGWYTLYFADASKWKAHYAYFGGRWDGSEAIFELGIGFDFHVRDVWDAHYIGK